MNDNLSQNQINIIKVLIDKDEPVYSKYIAERTGLSTRTIKSAISQINQNLIDNNAFILSDNRKGYWIENKDDFLKALSYKPENDIPKNSNQRVIAIVFMILSGKCKSLSQLSDTFFVSKTTIFNDFIQVKTIISASGGINLKKAKNGYYTVCGEEEAIRHFFNSVVALYYGIESGYLKLQLRKLINHSSYVNSVHQTLVKALPAENFYLSDRDLGLLAFKIIFAYFRIISGFSMNGIEVNHRHAWINKIESILQINFNNTETKYIFSEMVHESIEREVVASNNHEEILDEYIQLLESEDLSFVDFNRVRNLLSTFFENRGLPVKYTFIPKSFELKDHIYALDLVHKFDALLTKHNICALKESEIQELTASFSVILDSSSTKMSMIVLTDVASSFRDYVEYRLSTRFKFYINQIHAYPLVTISRLDIINRYTFIVCTSKNNLLSTYQEYLKLCNKDIVYISSDLDSNDFRIIDHYIHDHLPSRYGPNQKYLIKLEH